MTDERLSAPTGWREVDYDSDRPDVRQAKPPAVFEHDTRNIAVFVRPDDPGDATGWRLEIGDGGRDNFTDAEVVEREIEDRASAIGRAQDLMEALNREGISSSSAIDWETFSI